MTIEEALVRWPEVVPGSFEPAVHAARLVRLGCEAPRAITAVLTTAHGPEVSALAGGMLTLVPATGAEPAPLLRAVADSLRIQRRGLAHARAAAAGARASARMIVALPLAGMVLLPGQFARLLDPGGRASLVLGLGLCWAGLKWIDRLVPAPVPMPRVDMVPMLLAAALRAGCDVQMALPPIASACLEEETVRRVVRSLHLGMEPTEALARAEPCLARTADVLRRSMLTGRPAAEQLERLVLTEEDARAAAFETSLKKAPVSMVLPLGICVLPSFVLLCVIPLLRGVRIVG